MNHPKLYRTALVTALVIGASGMTIAAEVETAKPVTRSDIAENRTAADRDEKQTRIGDFVLVSEIIATGFYDDNIYASDSNEIDDSVFLLSPSLSLESDWKQHALQLEGGADLARYADHSDENYDDYWVNGTGRYTFDEQLHLFGGAGFRRAHEDRGSQDAVNGREPTLYTDTTLNGGVMRRSGNYSLMFGASQSLLNFDDVPANGGEIENDDRDRSVNTLSTRVGYSTGPDTEVFVHGVYEQREYDQTRDLNGFRRSSDGYRGLVGYKINKTGDIIAEIAAGYLSQSYDDARFDDIRELDFDINLKWKAAADSLITAYVSRNLGETTLYGSSGFLYTQYGIRLDQRVTPRLYADAAVSLGKADYYEINREDEYTQATAGLAYVLSDGVSLSLDYVYLGRDASVKNDDYDRQRFIASILASF